MPADASPMTSAQKLKLLRQIQYLLGQQERLLARNAGLTEEEFVELAKEQLIEVSFFEDEGPVLDRYHIDCILPKGELILAQEVLAEPDPLRITVVTPQKSAWQRIYEAMGNKLLAAIMNALSAAIGAVIGWYLKKNFP